MDDNNKYFYDEEKNNEFKSYFDYSSYEEKQKEREESLPPAHNIMIPNDPPKKTKTNKEFKKYIAVFCAATIFGSSIFGLGVLTGNNIATSRDTSFKVNIEDEQLNELKNMFLEKSNDAVAAINNNDKPLYIGNNNISDVVKKVSNSVVSINMEAIQRDMFNRNRPITGAGSGIIFKEDEEKVYIITNYHVIDGATKATISIDDDKQANAKYVGGDSRSDLAVIYVTKEELKNAGIDNYTVATLGDSEKLEIGESVIAIGNALGEGKSVTLGIISAKDKTINVSRNSINVIQTDAAINEGNSGGALINSKGEVIGINTAKFSNVGVEGMGYSIPINDAISIIEQLMTNGSIKKAYLGIEGYTVTPEFLEMYQYPNTDIKGAFIKSVVPNSPAHAAGLLSGDIIVGFADKKITSFEELSEAISTFTIGETAKIYVYRGVEPVVVEATIADYNAENNF